MDLLNELQSILQPARTGTVEHGSGKGESALTEAATKQRVHEDRDLRRQRVL